MLRNTGLWALFLSLSTMGCQPPSSTNGLGTESTGIIGGADVASGDFIAQRTAFLQFGYGRCTAVVIDSNIVLTAAHCVRSDGYVFGGTVTFTATPQADWVLNRNQSIEFNVEAVVVHSGYDDSTNVNDIAMVRIDGIAPIGFQPANLNLDSGEFRSFPSEKAILAGYGKTTDYFDSDNAELRLRIANVKVETESVEESLLRFVQDQGEAACAGDSGGPAFLPFGQDLRVVGVASYGTPGPAGFCHGKSYYTNLSSYKEWIKESYRKLVNERSTGRKDLL